ncbi:hypothetical protein [Varibaculum massiliense]|uniref:hypothetical protein n=1 Tax=Varibaculum massiliense TaxID=1852372 RepID=UPI002597E9E8|nr:hypothetical protein [Varibaculum massiliense]
MSRTRQVILSFALVAILMGIFAASHNFQTGQVGWNTAFTIIQTVLCTVLTVLVANDSNQPKPPTE